ncbi:hypothetical protein TNCV_2430381 [Trichonephila clavipes]|nr:hypothetical protein TNCV_2430381 [Trichonephila clavipes]
MSESILFYFIRTNYYLILLFSICSRLSHRATSHSQGGAPHSLINTALALFFNGQLEVADDDNPILFVSLSGLLVLFLSGSSDRVMKETAFCILSLLAVIIYAVGYEALLKILRTPASFALMHSLLSSTTLIPKKTSLFPCSLCRSPDSLLLKPCD